jgi:hypothetical protein
MSGSKINDYAIGDQNIQSVMLTLDKAFKGLHQVSLTNYDTTDESEIAAGSVVEVNGALYKFDSDESITGSPSDGTVYIYLVPSGDTVTAAYTNTAPTWSDSKQGWYGTGASANYRYLEFVLFKLSSAYQKIKFDSRLRKKIYFLATPSTTDSPAKNNYIQFDNVIIDSGNGYNSTTNQYFFPESGVYVINAFIARGAGQPTSFDCKILSAVSSPISSISYLSISSDSNTQIAAGSFALTFTLTCHKPAYDNTGVLVIYTGTAPTFTENSILEIIKISDVMVAN